MVTRADESSPSILKSAAKHKFLLAFVTLLTAAAAVYASRLLPTQAVARASILLEDTTQSDPFGTNIPASQNRLVQNQLEVLESGTVAARAAEIAAERGVDISIPDLLEGVEATTLADTDVIGVSYAGDSERTALTVVGSVIQAFQEVTLEQRETQTTTVLSRLESARNLLQTELEAVEADLDVALGVRQIEGWISRVLDEIIVVENALATATGTATRAALVTRSNQLASRLNTLQQAASVETASRSLRRLTQQRDELNDQLADIVSQRSAVRITSETEGSGIAFVDPAQLTSSSQGAGPLFTAGAGAALGFLLALGIASAISRRSDTFNTRRDPEALGIRLLADIPRIRVDTALPVRDAPRSAEAEAFRFVASNLSVAMDQQAASTVTFISATVGAGKSTLLANTAIATARAGKKVLAIDADFGNQALSHLLLGKLSTDVGLTELVANTVGVEEAIRPIDTVGAAHLDLLPRGGLQVVAPDFFAQDLVREVLERLQLDYDIIFIDSPPFLQVAYSGPVARLAGNGVLIIPHESQAARTADLLERSQFLGIHILGYIYNLAPMNRELLESGGSMKDVLGDRGFTSPVKARSGR